MAEICLVQYSDEYEERWDRFVLDKSINGTILQTRRFLNYHPADRFDDNSLMFMKGTEIIGVIEHGRKYGSADYLCSEGKIVNIQNSGIWIKVKDNVIVLTELKRDGRDINPIKYFINGNLVGGR